MNERGTFSTDVYKGLTTRSGVSLQTDDGNLHSQNDKIGAVSFKMLSHRGGLKVDAISGTGWRPSLHDEVYVPKAGQLPTG